MMRRTGMLNMMPTHLAEMEHVMPKIIRSVRKKYKKERVLKANAERKAEVAFLTGCIMDVMFSDINEATLNVLRRNGNDVVIPHSQTCCGALHVHAGDRDMGRQLAKKYRGVSACRYHYCKRCGMRLHVKRVS